MPLESGSSKAAFSHNVSEERKAGKPEDQAVAIAYATKRGDTFGESDEYNLGYADAIAGLPSSGEIGVESDYNRGYESGRVAGDRHLRSDAGYMDNNAKLDVALAKAVKLDAADKWEIEFDKKKGKRPLSGDSDAAMEAAAKKAGLWDGSGEFPSFTYYKNGKEMGGG